MVNPSVMKARLAIQVPPCTPLHPGRAKPPASRELEVTGLSGKRTRSRAHDSHHPALPFVRKEVIEADPEHHGDATVWQSRKQLPFPDWKAMPPKARYACQFHSPCSRTCERIAFRCCWTLKIIWEAVFLEQTITLLTGSAGCRRPGRERSFEQSVPCLARPA